jgi:hypothetical protein
VALITRPSGEYRVNRIVLPLGITLGLTSCVTEEVIDITALTPASSGVCDQQFSGLQNSQCLWVATGESVGVQWDVNVCASANGQPVQFTKLDGDQPSQCPQSAISAGSAPTCSFVNACYTGGLKVNGHNAAEPPWRTAAPATILGCSLPEHFDPLSECQALSLNCQPVQDQSCTGATAPYNYPYCSAGCLQTIDNDETLQLDPGHSLQAIMLSPPTFYTVTDTRQILRSGNFDQDASDVESGGLVFSYQMPVGANGALEANFSPNLFISRVRAVTNFDPTTFTRQYLSLLEVKVDSGTAVRCSGAAADATAVTADSCPNLGATTPVSVKFAPSLSGQPVIWRVKVLDAAHGGNAGLTRSSPVFIEFTLANSKGGSGHPFISPTEYHFGALPSGASRTDQGVLKLDLRDSPQDWVLDSTSTNNPQEFSLQVEGAAHIGAGGIRGIDVTFNPSSDGIKTATGTITLRDPAGNQVNVSADLEGESGAQFIVVFPDTVRYNNEVDRTTFQPLPLPWRKRFIIENAGYSPLIRQDVAIGGADAAAFQIYEGATGNSPVSPTFTLGSGDAEDLSVDFCPTRRGSFSAQVTVTVNVGTATVPVIGVSTVILRGTAPDAPAALCP